ncbi:putative integral membrane protein [Diplodia seriata]|uniref:Putative integral membrane protein n=1 Tax=Diplodia seriata TaxID=420778 RepID=A0A0G2FWD0_9PEZI|nr:putative integral membrane protein [Diplodia seriata]
MWKNEIQGVHAWEIPLERYNLYNLLIMCASVLYAPTQGFAKLSLLLFYRRLAPFAWFQAAIYAVMFVVISYTLGIMFSLIFPCKPIASNWDITIEGTCINKTGIYIATAVINIATDIALLLLPIPILARLQIPRLEKAALIAMFGVGSMTCITSVVRLILLLPMLTDLDQTWAVSIPCVWILVEANLVVICGCLPIVRKFARHVAPKLFFYSFGGSGDDHDPSSSSGGVGGSNGKKGKTKGRSRSRTAEFTFQTIGSKRSKPLVGGARKVENEQVKP